MMRRRDFLTASALAAAVAAKAPAAPPDLKGAQSRNRQSGVAYRRLGRTDYLVSEIVMGGNTIAPDAHDHVLAAIDRGLNYLDTAPAYGSGRSESGYAAVLQARGRDRVFLNSKVSLWDVNRNKLYRDIFASLAEPEQKKLLSAARQEIERRQAEAPEYFLDYFAGQRPELHDAALANVMEKQYGRQIDRRRNYRQLVIDSVEESLKRLRTDYLDLLMCPHGANTPWEILAYPEVFEAFESLKKAGKARHLGFSSHTDPAGTLEAAVKTGQYSAAMVAFNIINQPYVEKALAAAKKADVGVIAMKVARPVHMSRGRVTPPERIARIDAAVPGPLKTPLKAYAWALRNPHLSACVSEMITLEHVEDNLPLAAARQA